MTSQILVQSKGKFQEILETWYGCLNRAADHVCDTVSIDTGLIN
jgi:hypothetical protein